MTHKKFTREIILDTAFDLLRKQGARCFSAQRIAKHLGSSVQPIYSEFGNMEELEDALFKRLFFYFENCLYSFKRVDEKEETVDPIVMIGLNYLDFAENESNLYKAIYVEKFGRKHCVKEDLCVGFRRLVLSVSKYEELNEKEIYQLFSGVGVFLAGLSSLLSGEVIFLAQAERIASLERVIQAILQEEKGRRIC